MKKLTNLVKKENLNVEELMMIKGAVAVGCEAQYNSAKCDSNGCSSGVRCTGTSCSGAACNMAACYTSMGKDKMDY